MPFASFAFPVFPPRRWELVGLAAVIVALIGLSALDVGAQALLRVLGVVPGVVVGATMATRTAGPLPTWGGLAAACAVPAVAAPAWTLDAAITAVLFSALGMGVTAWRRLRMELTYARRADILAGLATVTLVLLAVGLSAVRGRLVWANGAAFAVGAVVLGVVPRRWEPPPITGSGTGSPERGSLLDRSSP